MRLRRPRRTTAAPLLAVLVLVASWGSKPGAMLVVVSAMFLVAAVLGRCITPSSSRTAWGSRSDRSCLPGRATIQEGGVHLVLLRAFLVLAVATPGSRVAGVAHRGLSVPDPDLLSVAA